MSRKVSRKLPGGQRKRRTKPIERKAVKTLTIPSPLQPDEVCWEIQLLAIPEQEFLALWNAGSDRIGFNLSEWAIYDKTNVVARITKEFRQKPGMALEEEE